MTLPIRVDSRCLDRCWVAIDAIAAQSRCINIAPFPSLCDPFREVPIIGNDGSEAIQPENLAIVNTIGYDNNDDGAIDSLEDAAPNGGDGNNDGIMDSTQVTVASFPGSAGEFVVIEAPATAAIRSLDILGTTFALANLPAFSGLFDVLDFSYGFAGFDLAGIAPGAAASVTETFITGFTADTYYAFGPTADNATPHWYEFLYDGMTGAEINGNLVTLHFVDGQRGDSDLEVNGAILDPGAPAQKASISGSSGGGGGCSVIGQAGNPAQAGAWWLLFMLIALLRTGSAAGMRSRL